MPRGLGTHPRGGYSSPKGGTHSPWSGCASPRYMGHGILCDTVDKRSVRILLECFLVYKLFT